MGIPTAIVEMEQGGWQLGVAGKSELGVTTQLTYSGWTDLSQYVRRFSIRRGRQHELDKIDAGTGAITFRNVDGRFDPTNLASDYAPKVRPMVRIRIRATWDGITYPVFFGYAESWTQGFTRGPAGDASVTVRLVDGFKRLNLDTVDVARSVEGSGARVAAVLDSSDFSPDERSIDAGNRTVSATVAVNQNTLSYLQTIADSEGGPLFVAADGKIAFRSGTTIPALDSTNDTFGDGGGTEKDYDDVTLAHDDANIWNSIRVSSPGLDDAVAEDDYSASTYGRRVLARSTILADTTQMASRATDLVNRYKEAHTRITNLNLEARGDDTQWSRILGHDLHDQVRVTKRPPFGGTISQDSFIEGINHDVAGQKWTVSWALSPLS